LGISSLVPINVAQPETRHVLLGMLQSSWDEPNSSLLKPLQDLGYERGRNLTIEFRSAHGHNEDLPKLAAELVSLKPDVLIATGTAAVRAAKNATSLIPIVMNPSGDPVGNGFAQSFAHPGGNVTGRSDQAADLAAKRLELLQETLPGICCVVRIANSSNPGNVSGSARHLDAAKRLGIESKVIWVATPEQLEEVLAAPLDDRFKALLIAADQMLISQRGQIAKAALRRGLAAFGATPEEAQEGFLEGLGEDYIKGDLIAATYVDKILKGANPGDLPVIQPTEFQLVVNLKTAKALGLTVPQSILARAHEVIE
jgi:putative ABC transport system substrate-binding protein